MINTPADFHGFCRAALAKVAALAKAYFYATVKRLPAVCLQY